MVRRTDGYRLGARVRIVVLDSEDGVWCGWCGLPCATRITYVIEDGENPSITVCRLVCCDGCETDAARA